MANERHSYVEFYPSDWTGGTAYMPVTAEWLYLQVCLYNWDKREPVPPAQAALRFSRSPSWEADLAMLIDAGKVIRTTAGGLFVERAMVAANKAYDLWERKSRGGKSRQAAELQAKAQDGSMTPDSTPSISPVRTAPDSLASNQNQNQNQSHLDGDSPPKPPADKPGGDLLFSVSADALKAFRDHRTKTKNPMTVRAEELLIGKLKVIWEQRGHDPTAVIDQSIFNGWRGVFPLKEQDDGGANRFSTGAASGGGDGFSRAADRRMGRG